MTGVRFTVRGLSRTRLGVSPLSETVFSVAVVKAAPARFPLHRPWTLKTRRRLKELDADLSLLSALVQVDGPICDWLTPASEATAPNIAAELDLLRRTPASVVREELDLEWFLPRDDRVAALYADPEPALAALADTIHTYWQAAIAPHWPALQSTLNSDIAYRARQLATGGPQSLFTTLHPTVTWDDDGDLRWNSRESAPTTADTEGLLLQPTAFSSNPRSTAILHSKPVLNYPARAVAALWEPAPQQADPAAALAKILGHTRALLLTHLTQPATTTDLAHHTGMTTGGVSQHLTALHNAGLLSRHRDGTHVIYTHTPLTTTLLNPINT